jgi:predicted ribosomally synthesized peptide with nif11-like leader
MSIGHAKEFLRELTRNDELKAKLSACSTSDERLNLAKESGFEFTAEELNRARTELFEHELDAISGGGTCCGFTNENCPNCENDNS